MLSWRRAGRRCAGFFLLGVLAVVSLSACDPAPQATSVPDQTEASDTTQAPTSDSTPTPTPVPDQTEASDATQIPTSDSTRRRLCRIRPKPWTPHRFQPRTAARRRLCRIRPKPWTPHRFQPPTARRRLCRIRPKPWTPHRFQPPTVRRRPHRCPTW